MTVRLGLIGAGGIAQYHLDRLNRIEDAQVVRVYDVNAEQVAKLAGEIGAEVSTSAERLLDNREIDAALVCAPQFARGQLEEIAASRGIHLLIEKPLGLSMDEVRRKQQSVQDSGIINSVGYCLRYLDTVQKARSYLQGKPIHLIQIQRFGTAHPSKWWSQLGMSGGFLVDAVTHQVDLVRYLIGEFRDVYANFGRNSIQVKDPESTIYDGGALSFTMRNGAVGTITESCVSPYNGDSEIKFFGPDYYVSLSANGLELKIMDETQMISETAKLDATFEQDKAFVEAVKGGSQLPVLCDYEDAARTLSFTLAANQSAIQRSPFDLI